MASDKTKKIVTKRPALFSNLSGYEADASQNREVRLKLLSDTNFASTSSFRYDTPGAGIKSTQQIPVDWSRFENHVFFDSAQSKINVASDVIVNSFPFDGDRKKVESFFQKCKVNTIYSVENCFYLVKRDLNWDKIL